MPYQHPVSSMLFGRINVDKHFEKYGFLLFLILTKSLIRSFGRKKEMVGTGHTYKIT